jgi:hypothetical protein
LLGKVGLFELKRNQYNSFLLFFLLLQYTQAEIAMFFKLCRRQEQSMFNGLFLAGDPAQSVVEGVHFRFEEVRSVAYRLLPEDEQNNPSKRRGFVPDKPKKVTVNFRSHAGILNVAADVLDLLFTAFPKSAPDLGKDAGVFNGPRPGFFEVLSKNMLQDLVAKIDGVGVLTTNDEEVERLEKLFPKGVVVLTIRDSKGLEFSDVIICDFFRTLADEHQKPWRNLLREGADLAPYQDTYPEIETHLKQLYTAITRCRMRLFFAETGQSEAGTAFGKFVNRKKLCSKQKVVNVEKMVKTQDQWKATGMDYAKYAESADDFGRSKYWLEKAVACFENAEDPHLQEMAQTHLESLRLREKIYFNAEEVSGEDEVELQARVAAWLEKFVFHGPLVEASQLCTAVLPYLGDFTRRKLEERVLPLLPAVDE